MNIEEIIREWKEGKQEKSDQHLLKNPVGEELSDVELAEAIGGQGANWQNDANGQLYSVSGGCTAIGCSMNCPTFQVYCR